MTQPAPDKPVTTLKDLIDAIEERCEVDFTVQPVGDHCVWFPQPGKTEPLVFAVGEPLPLKPTLDILFVFQDETEIRVYAVPGKAASGPEKLRCYTLSKSAPTYFVDLLPADAFVSIVADEWLLKSEGSTTLERERARVLDYLDAWMTDAEAMAKSPAAVIGEIRAGIEEGVHAEPDEEEPEPEAPPAPPAESPPTPAAPADPPPATAPGE